METDLEINQKMSFRDESGKLIICYIHSIEVSIDGMLIRLAENRVASVLDSYKWEKRPNELYYTDNE